FIFTFFFQAEDGIRDFHVTGVQTCALPIYDAIIRRVFRPAVIAVPLAYFHVVATQFGKARGGGRGQRRHPFDAVNPSYQSGKHRSEERRVGKECRTRWWPYHEKKKEKADEV